MLEFERRSPASVQNPDTGSDVLFLDNDGVFYTKDDTGALTVLGRGIASIALTGTAGLVDTYTITFSGGTTQTYTVTNGADGVGMPATNAPSKIDPDDAADIGTRTGFFALEDHQHQIDAAAPVALGASAAEGTSAAFSRADHVHLNPVIAHEAAGDPHPQYTTPAEASAVAPVQSVFGRSGTVTALAADYSAFYQALYFVDARSIGISTANTAAQNTTAFNNWFATAPVNFTLQFPDGTFDFDGELTLNRNLQGMFRGMGKARTILRITNATANLFHLSISAYYYSFEELGFNATVTKTAGAFIKTNPAAGDNAYLDVRRCEMKNYFNGISLDGVGAGNVGTISEVLMNTPVANSVGLRINGENINMMVTNCTINQNPGSAGLGTCVEVLTSGAVQFMGCDFIGGQRTLDVNPTVSPVSALYFTNCFFDQAGTVAVEFRGNRAISRVKFVQCGITNGNVASSIALRVAGTGTGVNIPEALDFELCDFYNSFAGLSCTGIVLSGFRGVDIKDCRVSGFTVGVDITPYDSNGTSNFNLQGNTIGPTENFPGNGTGLRINAGSFSFAGANISFNNLSGNTTQNYVGNGTYVNGQIQLIGNLGLPFQPQPTAPNLLLTAAATAVRAGNSLPVPANSVRPGTSVRFTVQATNAATASTNTITVRFGTANTNADAAIQTLALGAGTAALGGAVIVATVTFLSATTAISSIQVFNNAATGFTNAVVQSNTITTPATISTTAAAFLGLYISPSAANVVTIRSSNCEVINQ